MMKKRMSCVLFLVFILSIAGCIAQAETVEAAEELITVTLTPQYAGYATDEALRDRVGTDYQSAEIQEDGSVVLKMTAEQYDNYIDMLRGYIVSAAQNMVANDQNNITDISFNENFSEFQITVKTDTLHRSDADSAFYMFTALGRHYQCVITDQYLTTGSEDFPVVVSFLDADGNILEEAYNPESNA